MVDAKPEAHESYVQAYSYLHRLKNNVTYFPSVGLPPPMVKARSSENEKGKYLRLMELADVQDSKSCGEIREGSTPSPKTNRIMRVTIFKGLFKRKRKGGNSEQTNDMRR